MSIKYRYSFLQTKYLKKHPKENGDLKFTFVTDGIESAVHKAIAAAGKKDVTIIGSANTTQQFLNAKLADELEVDIIPTVLRRGFRPFENIDTKSIKLVRKKTIELPAGRTHLKFRVTKWSKLDS